MMGVKKVNDPQGEPIENQSLANTSNIVENIEGETKVLNAAYSDTFSDSGGLSSPSPGEIKV